ncbi:hypothetical protein AOLI_G00159580 [Acnodon oligacanthus]
MSGHCQLAYFTAGDLLLGNSVGFCFGFWRCGRCFEVMPRTRRKTGSGKGSTKKRRTAPVEIEDRGGVRSQYHAGIH